MIPIKEYSLIEVPTNSKIAYLLILIFVKAAILARFLSTIMERWQFSLRGKIYAHKRGTWLTTIH